MLIYRTQINNYENIAPMAANKNIPIHGNIPKTNPNTIIAITIINISTVSTSPTIDKIKPVFATFFFLIKPVFFLHLTNALIDNTIPTIDIAKERKGASSNNTATNELLRFTATPFSIILMEKKRQTGIYNTNKSERIPKIKETVAEVSFCIFIVSLSNWFSIVFH